MPNPPDSASPRRVVPPAERLVLTYTMRLWHISKPDNPFYSLCSEWTREPGGGTPRFSDVCRRCLKSYQRELRERV